VHKFSPHFLFILLFISASCGFAAPLGTIPVIESRNLRLFFDGRSDLWSAVAKVKSSPVRITAAEVQVPIAHAETWKASFNASDESLSLGRADFSLGKKKVFIGSDLRSESFGLGLNKEFESGSSVSIFAAFATASDRPYGAPRDEWIESNLVYRSPKLENHRWIFVVNQSNNRGFKNGTPFPYFGVSYEPEPEFKAMFGFPFLFLTWGTPDKDWKKDFKLTPFGTRFDLETNLEDQFVFNAFAAFTVRSYLHDERIDDDDRLYYQEFSIETSVRRALSSETTVLFGIGYSFDRRLYESETIYSPNSEYTIMNNDVYGRIAMEFRL
jgi:hypothetical protein